MERGFFRRVFESYKILSNPVYVCIEIQRNSDRVVFLCFEQPEVSPDSISYKTTIRVCENSSRWQFAQCLMAEHIEG